MRQSGSAEFVFFGLGGSFFKTKRAVPQSGIDALRIFRECLLRYSSSFESGKLKPGNRGEVSESADPSVAAD